MTTYTSPRNETVLVGFRCDPEMKERLSELAWRQRRSVSALVRELVLQQLAEQALGQEKAGC